MQAIHSTPLQAATSRGRDALNDLLTTKRDDLRRALNAWLSGQPVPKQRIDELHADIAGAQAALRNL